MGTATESWGEAMARGTTESYETVDAWRARARELFGDDSLDWAFVCPVCKHRQTGRDYKAAGAPMSAVAFSCVGRWVDGAQASFELGEGGPCNYAGGGLFKLNPVRVEETDTNVFAFGEVV